MDLLVLVTVVVFLLGMAATLLTFADDLLTAENLPLAVVAGYFWPLVLAYGLTRWAVRRVRRGRCK